MTTLIIGASGATGKLLVGQLLNAGQRVKILIRPGSNIPEAWNSNEFISIVRSDFQKIDASIVQDCEAVASCLGHNPTFKGIYGKPRRLVTNTVRLLCEEINKAQHDKKIKFVLMSSAGVSNPLRNEPSSFLHKTAIGLIRSLVPPHADNEQAAAYLSRLPGSIIEWVAVRPDTLINEKDITPYSLHESPIRSALFNPGKTSRINVANFMCELLIDGVLWNKWKGQMPVIYNEK